MRRAGDRLSVVCLPTHRSATPRRSFERSVRRMSETSLPPSEAVIQTAARLLAAGRAAEAAERLQQLVKEAPTYAAAHVLLASALDASGRPQDALEAWRRAAFLVPHSPLVHRERQRLLEAQSGADTPAPVELAETEPWDDEPSEPAPAEEPPEAPAEDPPTNDSPPDSLEAEPSEATRPSPDPEPQLEADAVPHAEGSQADEAQPLDASPLHIEDEPREVPLLPPEGDASSTARAPAPDLELDDDGWTILEDDVSPPEDDAPVPTAVLPPEPEAIPVPPPTEAPTLDPEPSEPEPPASASEPVSLEPDSSLADDLDDLITQLDAAPRIKPDPTFEGPKVTFDDSSMDDMVSETLAKIYAAQHQYVEAAVVYEKLAVREPDHATELLERAAEMRDKAR